VAFSSTLKIETFLRNVDRIPRNSWSSNLDDRTLHDELYVSHLSHKHMGIALYFTSDRVKLFFIIISGVGLGSLGTAATSGLLYKPQMIDEGDCGAIGGMKIGRRNRSTRRKPAPAPLCPPQIPHDQTRARTRAATVGSQRLTAWAMARPS
jgi:hypothetical protein